MNGALPCKVQASTIEGVFNGAVQQAWRQPKSGVEISSNASMKEGLTVSSEHATKPCLHTPNLVPDSFCPFFELYRTNLTFRQPF